jgi:hypothetical protein
MSDTMTFNKSDFLHQVGFYTGSETFYRHPLSTCIYTEGVKFVAEKCEAFWLIDKIAINDIKEPFQVWKLKVNTDRTALLTTEDGNDTIVHTETLSYTDFPLDEFTIWRVDDTILLPSEY